ncbi:hypothetical protein GCM10020254_68560 [Streptomyces goshikiensis]
MEPRRSHQSDESHESLESLARELAGLPPSLGPVRLIGIDGHAGSGKSTFAGRLAEALGGVPVLHLDDIATHEELFGWQERLRAQVLEPLAAGRPAHWAPYDWVRRRFGPERVLDPVPLLLVEGVGGRAAGAAAAPGAAAVDGDAARAVLGGAGETGTGVNSPTSGTDGSARSSRTSRMTLRAPSPTPWYARAVRDTSGLPGRVRPQEPPLPSLMVTGSPRPEPPRKSARAGPLRRA